MTIADHQAAEQLIHQFWACIDEMTDIAGPGMFAPGGALVIESFQARGEDELARYFAGRRALSVSKGRRTRHICSNLRVLEQETDRIRIQTIVTVFSGYGALPMDLGSPSTLCDFSFDCVRLAEGWKFARIDGLRIFAGGDTPDLAKAGRDVQGG